MNSACLSIKFRPLITTVNQKSLCCLEIVPEISGLDNLDTANWKDDELEYSIPMVYKVILKRRQSTPKDTKGVRVTDGTKTYHSCVDLLNTDSTLDVTYSQGDCCKNISDTFIFGKLLSDIQNFGMFLQKLDNNNSLTAVRRKHETELQQFENNASLKDLSISTKTTPTINVIELHDVATEDSVLDNKPESLTIPTNTDVTKLSVTPICSFNTTSDKQVNIAAGTHSYLMMFKPSILSTPEQKPPNAEHSVKIVSNGYDSPKSEKSLSNIKIKSNSSVRTTQQTLAQCRITQFRIQMKKEIMPLNELLDKLIEKCVHLGINKRNIDSDAPTRTWKLGKSLSGSNRVVYTIVSEG